MEKTIIIDEKEVRLKSTGGTAIRFKAQFGKDYFAQLLKLAPLGKIDMENLDPSKLDNVDFEVFYNLVWTMAKTADPKTPEPMTWLDSFDEFPIIEILEDIQDMIVSTIQSKKKR
ncbi:prophage pi2 protein 40 [Bacillus cereus]|nr:prophage pi2 protein 40 [Bacillus cereus]